MQRCVVPEHHATCIKSSKSQRNERTHTLAYKNKVKGYVSAFCVHATFIYVYLKSRVYERIKERRKDRRKQP